MQMRSKLLGGVVLISLICAAAVACIEDINYSASDVQFAPTAVTSENAININTASEEELCRLDGIGAAMAERIVTFRTINRRFETIYDLKLVNGIGDKLFENNKANIKVD